MGLRCTSGLLLALALTACSSRGGEAQDRSELLSVNGEVLSRVEFEKELRRELASAEAPQRTPEQVEPFKRALVQTATERMLLLQSARQHNVTVTPDEVDRRVLRLSSDFPAGNFHEALAQGQLSLAELKQRTAASLIIEKLFANHVYPRVALTEEELRAYFAAHESEFTEPERVRASQLVVRDLEEARRVQAQLKTGERFADLARKYSLSADAKVGGDLGVFARGVMPPEFDEVVFELSPGQVSDVVSTDYGFHLFRLQERVPGRKRGLPEVRGEIEKRLLTDKRADAQARYLKDLQARATVRVNEPVLLEIR